MTLDQKLATLFPSATAIPPEALVETGGTYNGGLDYLIDGKVLTWAGATVPVESCVCIDEGGELKRKVLGPAAQLDEATALLALDACVKAWDQGRGVWPTSRIAARIEAVEAFMVAMKAQRELIVRLLMWEIGKSRADAEKEFDRTVVYVDDTVEAVKSGDREASRFTDTGGILAQIRRAPLGPTLCMGPFNYPLNETFTTLIPALIMGNPVVVKFPRFGALCQAPLVQAFADCFPPGVVNIVNGDGRTVAGPLVADGRLAVLAFIGSAKVANVLKKQHPRPNRLRAVLGLDAKNAAVVLPDADLDQVVAECLSGSLSYNGQRCTALKLLFVHRSLGEAFVEKLAAKVDELPFGLPWEKGVKLTPLPEYGKPEAMEALVADAVAKGARVVNAHGGKKRGTFFFPAVVWPVAPTARLYVEEQFGPVVPVVPYDDLQDVMDFVAQSNYGQQVSIFGKDPAVIGPLVDFLMNQVSRVNLNAQCQRGPDVFPFTGRKDSAEGTLSVSDALRAFSIRAMVGTPDNAANRALLGDVLRERTSTFLHTDYLF